MGDLNARIADLDDLVNIYTKLLDNMSMNAADFLYRNHSPYDIDNRFTSDKLCKRHCHRLVKLCNSLDMCIANGRFGVGSDIK